MAARVPWDAPSRYGRAGRVGRAVLRRLTRPLEVRAAADAAAIAAEVARLRSEVERSRRAHDVALVELSVAADAARATDLALDAALAAALPTGARIRRSFGDGSRVICALATGHEHRALLGRSALSYDRYAERWGWDVVLSTETDLAHDRPPPWGKIQLLLDVIEDHEWVLLLDADVVVTDLEADILAEAEVGRDLYLVEHPWLGQHTANSGVMLLRGGSWSRSFLEAVWDFDQEHTHPFWENHAVARLLGYGADPYRLVEPTAWLARTKFLDRRFNAIELDRPVRPAFVHRGFYDVGTRTRQVAGDLPAVLGDAHPSTAGLDRPARAVRRVRDVRRRHELPLLLNALGRTEGAVELGVGRGQFSEWILDTWEGDRLFSIDPWVTLAPEEDAGVLDAPQELQDANHAEAERRLARHGERSVVWRATGDQAAPRFPEPCLDFVYIDARHDEASVRHDLAQWWPKLRSGGIFAGRGSCIVDDDVEGVRTAVDAFAADRGLEVHVTDDDGRWPIWVIAKP